MKQSILNEFTDKIDWSQSLDVLKTVIIQFIETNCKNNWSRTKMVYTVQNINDLVSLQKYTFNALLKFEGNGVIQPIPR